MTPTYIPILPRHKIQLFLIDGDGERFARLFRDVWRQLPLGVRRLLLKGWRADRWRCLVVNSPFLEMLPDWSSRTDGDIAAVFCAGHQIRFCSCEMDELTDDEYRFTIAHELAHCVQDFSGYGTTSDAAAAQEYNERGGAYFAIEDDADSMAMDWGFPKEAERSALDAVLVGQGKAAG